MAADAGPNQGPAVTPDTNDRYDAAVLCNCAARLSQAAAAVSIGPEPGPEYIKVELTSGGISAKLITIPR